MEVRRSYEGLEVAAPTPTFGRTAEHTPYTHDQLQSESPYGLPSPPPGYGNHRGQDKGFLDPSETHTPPKPKKRRKWWIVGLVALIIIIAAIGGGVGGALGSRSKNSDAASTSTTSTASLTISNAGMPTTAASPSKLAGMPAGTATRTVVPSAIATASKSICSDYLCTRMLSAISWTSQYSATIFGAGVHNDRLLYKNGRDTTFDETWSTLPGVFSYPPVVVSWGEGRIDVFAIGLDGAMYERHYDYPAWSPEWVSLGGFFTSPPAAVSWGAGRLDVWGIGSNSQMYHKAYDGHWDNEWYSVGGNFSSPPSAASWGPQRLDFVGLDTSNTLVQNYWDTDFGGWGEWNPLAGTSLKSPPVISSRASQSVDVVGLGNNGSMMHISYNRSWGSWEALNDGPKGTWGSEPVAVVSDTDQLDIFAIASDGALWHNRLLSNVRGPWTYLGGVCQSAPAAVGKNGTVSVFCINLSQSMSTRTLENSTWTEWSGLDGEFAIVL